MSRDNQRVHAAIDQLKVQLLNFGYEGIVNSAVRAEYLKAIKGMSDDVLQAYQTGLLNADETISLAAQMRDRAEQFARRASAQRNVILNNSRAQQTTLGRRYAESLKDEGRKFEDLMSHYASKKYKKAFDALDDFEKEQVFIEIIKASGRDRASATTVARRLKWGGRIFWMFTIGIAAYNIGSSEDKAWATGREAAMLGGGFAGGAATGALVGIWAGPIGVGVGVVVGGILGSIIAEETYLELAGPERDDAAAILSAHTGWFHMDEQGVANALVNTAGINLEQVYIVFLELDANYNGDADEVAYYYVNAVKQQGGALLHGLKLDKSLRNLLIRLLDEGWTTDAEYRTMNYLKSL